MARKIEVVDYNPEWEKQFKEEAKKIKAILGKNCVEIHHIGSTSVKGLKAKPVIDIMPVVKDISLVDGQNAQFEALGYECMGEFGIPGRRFYRKGGDNRTHHIHIFQKDNTAQIQRHLAVRDYLRSNKEKAEEYASTFPFFIHAIRVPAIAEPVKISSGISSSSIQIRLNSIGSISLFIILM